MGIRRIELGQLVMASMSKRKEMIKAALIEGLTHLAL